MTAPQKKRYPLRVYALLILILAVFSLINTVFSDLEKAIEGNFNLPSLLLLTGGLVLFALIFAVLIWIADTRGIIGRLLGARDADKQLSQNLRLPTD